MENNDRIKNSMIEIAVEHYRLKKTFMKAISKLDFTEQNKYMSQFSWFSKKVVKALDDIGLKIINVDGQLYDPGMAVTPLNIEDFEADDILYVEQTVEPIIMQDNTIIKTGTVILGRVQKWDIT